MKNENRTRLFIIRINVINNYQLLNKLVKTSNNKISSAFLFTFINLY